MPQYRYVISVRVKTDCNDLGEPAVVVASIGDGTRPLHPAGNPAKNDPFFENTTR
jgi:hypothetical protein